MRYFIMGATSFTGGHIIDFLSSVGSEVTALVRDAARSKGLEQKGVRLVVGDPLQAGKWQDVAAKCDVILNLVGRPIFARWDEKAMQEILATRIRSTEMAAKAACIRGGSDMTLINTNAIGYYGDTGEQIVTETSPSGAGFLAEVCVRWQEAAQKAEESGVRVVFPRFGAVLGQNGGILAQILSVFRLGLGGRISTGRQWFSWIHVHDLARAIGFVANDRNMSGAVNFCSPEPVRNVEFTETLAEILKRPAIFPVPAFALRLALGGAADIALWSQRVLPDVLSDAGFIFDFPSLETALKDILLRGGSKN